jgi:NADH-quinone oxidoreductase subunit C
MSVEVTERRVAPSEWLPAARAARDEGYAYFDWLAVVDETDAPVPQAGPAADGTAAAAETPGETAPGPGLDVVCHLLDVSRAASGGLRRLLLRTRVPDGGSVPSLTGIFAGAAWHEREAHEMFGLDVDGFEDGTGLGLRPLLLPEGFEGRPLRKDFVLGARASKPWPGAKEPGEGEGSSTRRAPSRRRLLPPGVPDPEWGPRGD